MKRVMVTIFTILLLCATSACDGKNDEAPQEDFASPAQDAYVPEASPTDWWYGFWYGYWMVAGESEGYEIPMEYKWDCYAESQRGVDDIFLMRLWDDGMELGNVTLRMDYAEGSGDRGRAVAEGGTILEEPVWAGDWTLDPEQSPYADQIIINMRAEYDGGEYVDYQIVLRPWGMLWDDIPEDERPPYYEWYLGVCDDPASNIPFHIH